MVVSDGRESCLLCGKTPGLGENIVVIGKKLQHPIEISGEKIFAADLKHSGKVLERKKKLTS